jgi:hypothetical protein
MAPAAPERTRRREEPAEEGAAKVSDQTAIGLATLILVCFWIVVSADAMTAPSRRLKGPAWVWLLSFVVSCLVAGYNLWTLL